MSDDETNRFDLDLEDDKPVALCAACGFTAEEHQQPNLDHCGEFTTKLPAPIGAQVVDLGEALKKSVEAPMPAAPEAERIAASAPAAQLPSPLPSVDGVVGPGRIITVDAADETTGAVTYWQLSGEAELDQLCQAWEAAGLNDEWLPKPVSPTVAFGRAVRELAGRNIMVRKHPQGGWAVVQEEVVENELSYRVAAHFILDEEGKITVKSGSAAVEPVLQAFEHHVAHLSTTDISEWLVDLASAKLGGIALRDRGGVYFLPHTSMDAFHKAKAAVSSVTRHAMYEIPAVRSTETLAAVVDALKREVAEFIAEWEGEVEEVGPRAARTRMDACDVLMAKVRGYEELLGQGLAGLREAVSAMRGRFEQASSRTANLEVV